MDLYEEPRTKRARTLMVENRKLRLQVEGLTQECWRQKRLYETALKRNAILARKLKAAGG